MEYNIDFTKQGICHLRRILNPSLVYLKVMTVNTAYAII